MDKVKKRITIRGVLDGLRFGGSTPKADLPIEETLRSGHFQVAKTVRHGFPYRPTAIAYDPVQNLLAIGTKTGSLRLFGRPGVDVHIEHDGEPAILQILFLVNQGGLVTLCDDHRVHLWDIRKKHPTIVHTLKFLRERVTFGHHPFESKWIYIGTEKGNVHIIKTEGFERSGYVINWNEAIELMQKTLPGSVIHLSENPIDPNKLLIGYESGLLVLWDLKLKAAEARYNSTENLVSVCWNHEGKLFMCSHTDGSLSTWNIRIPQKPQTIIMPHAKIGKDGKPEPCRPMGKMEWKSIRNGEPYMIFSGGMPQDKSGSSPCLTVMHSKNTTVLEMEHDIVDFLSLCTTPWKNDFQDPFAIVVLLVNDLVVIDLTSQGYPCFENPYPMDIHESPVTACLYMANCAPHLIPAFYTVGSKQKKAGYSPEEWPIKGGECGPTTTSYNEIIITGHADGSLKFWEASALSLQILYKLKTAKLFDKHRCLSPDVDDDPFAIQLLHMCADSRLLCVAGITHMILFKFSTQENTIECPTLEVSIVYEIFDEIDPSGLDLPPVSSKPCGITHQSSSVGSYSSITSDSKEKQCCVTAKSSNRKWAAGFQPDLCGILTWINGEPPPPITSLSLNSSYGLMAFANECGICIIDIIQKTTLLTMGTPDLYGPMDPYSRAPHSPKNKVQARPSGLEGLSQTYSEDESKSPTQDQMNGLCLSPTASKGRRSHAPELKRTKSQDKTDGSFSRSRSSSMSSLENISNEAIQCLVFADAFTRKTDSYTYPCLWVGTVLGSVLIISISLPEESDRKTQPVIVSPSGTIFRLKGSILTMSFLDCNGILIPAVTEQWKDECPKDGGKKPYNRQQSVSSIKSRMSPTSSQEMSVNTDRQLAILCSERHARVITLPSQTVAYKMKITDTSVVAKAEVINVRDSVCLGCYVANGHVMILSLPSLKSLIDVVFIPSPSVRIAKTFCFSNNGHALYFSSPTEVQKITFSADICENLKEMLPDLFKATDTPEAPKQNFFKNFFSGGPAMLDREALFGSGGSGKPSSGVAAYTAGTGQIQVRAVGAMSEIAMARQAAEERGQKLAETEEATERMRNEAAVYSQRTKQVMQKYRDKKWYQF